MTAKSMRRPLKPAPGRKKAAVPAAPEAARPSASLRKQYFKTKPFCRVTFRLAKEAVAGAAQVAVVGDFNGWDPEPTRLKRLKNGDFTVTLDLARDREYCFRYLIDGRRWENDWAADSYRPNEYGSEDSVAAC